MTPTVKPAVAAMAMLAICSICTARPETDCFPDVDLIESDGLGVNFFPPASQMEITTAAADLFELSYFPTHKVLNNTNQGEVYVLYQCGVLESDVRALFEGENATASSGIKYFSVPLANVALQDTTPNKYLELLGVLDRVAYASAFSVDSCMLKVATTCERDYDSTSLNETASDGVFTFAANPADPMTIAFTASADPGVLNRFEWIKFLAAFFNKEAVANELFDKVSEEYNAIKVDEADMAEDAPVVAFVQFSNYSSFFDGVEYKGLEVDISFAAYLRELIAGAGGRSVEPILEMLPNMTRVDSFGSDNYLYRLDILNSYGGDVDAAMEFLREEVLTKVDVVIDGTGPFSVGLINYADLDMEVFRSTFRIPEAEDDRFPFLATPNVWRNDKKNSGTGTAWFQDVLSSPVETLQDFQAAISPQLVPEDYRQLFLRNIAAGQAADVPISAEDCPELGCNDFTLPASICPAAFVDCDGEVAYRTLGRCNRPSCSR